MAETDERMGNIFQSYAVETKTPFDLERLSDRFRARNTDWSIPQALLCILLTTGMADGDFGDEEAETIRTVARRSRVLGSLSPQELSVANDVVNERLHNRPSALQEACDTLPTDMRLPAFALAVDVVLADGELLRPEAEFLQSLVTMLDIDPDHARRVMEVLLLKNQY
jgi:uncharacterized tellurite resistance protein B-like protein